LFQGAKADRTAPRAAVVLGVSLTVERT